MTLILGGVVLPTLWDAGRKTGYKCSHCNAEFGIRTLGAKISQTCFWVLILIIIIGVIIALQLDIK